AVQARCADNHSSLCCRSERSVLSSQPSDAVNLQRSRSVAFDVGCMLVAGKHIITTEINQPCSGFRADRRQISHSDAIDQKCLFGLFLTQGQVMKSSAVDYAIRNCTKYRPTNLIRPR